MVVLNQLVSHSSVLHRSFTGSSVDFDNDCLLGGERIERPREINYASLGFHVILDMRDTSSGGRSHSYILDKVEGIAQINCPCLGFCEVSSLQTG